jgi:hypothetical protein
MVFTWAVMGKSLKCQVPTLWIWYFQHLKRTLIMNESWAIICRSAELWFAPIRLDFHYVNSFGLLYFNWGAREKVQISPSPCQFWSGFPAWPQKTPSSSILILESYYQKYKTFTSEAMSVGKLNSLYTLKLFIIYLTCSPSESWFCKEHVAFCLYYVGMKY